MKRINTNSNIYIILYSAALVTIVAFLLAFVYNQLKPMQDTNVSLDKKRQILAALNIRNLPNDSIAITYSDVVVSDKIFDKSGKLLNDGKMGDEAGFLLNSADFKSGKLALFECEVANRKILVVPVYGMGLWGNIWGYIAINEDFKTVNGAYFDHSGETAGLGAEIKDNVAWQNQFIGKRLFDSRLKKVVLSVVKSNTKTDDSSQCDAITGATLTSDGVSNMIRNCLEKYSTVFTTLQNNRNGNK